MCEKLQKLACIDNINAALKVLPGHSYVEPPKQLITLFKYKQLDRLQIDQGVIAFVLACNLSGGSMGDMDMYKLSRAYLWNENARAEINAVVERHGF
jgi:hypothetical protein